VKVGKVLSSAEFHKWATISWSTIGSMVSMAFPHSVPWVVFMSLYANVASHWSSYQAARAEQHPCPHCGKKP
jgi:hypothetical protein